MTIDQLKQTGFRFQKRFGQNFITDTNLLHAIVADAAVGKDDTVVEVGAGAGSLTRALCERVGQVIAYEIDPSLAPALDALQQEFANLRIVYADVLSKKPHDAQTQLPQGAFHLVANLPYYITTPVLFHFLEYAGLRSVTVMVQKEVAERFTAAPNTPSYGAVTAQLAAYGTAKITRTVSRNLFTPAPNVDSAVVHLAIQKKQGVADFSLLRAVIAASFAMRRKTLCNNLVAGFSLARSKAEEFLAQSGIASDVRGEVLHLDDFVRLANTLSAHGIKKK